MEGRTYHGWIFQEKVDGFQDSISIQVRKFGKAPLVKHFGRGEQAAADAVDFFETGMELGRVSLEQTPLGLRVYTEAGRSTTTLEGPNAQS